MRLTAILLALALTLAGCSLPAPAVTVEAANPVDDMIARFTWHANGPGYGVYTVNGVSMEPFYSTGDHVFVVPVAGGNLRVGSVAIFRNREGFLVCHMVYDIRAGAVLFVAYQDGKQTRDGWGWVPLADVIGVVVRVMRVDPAI